jgi:beta-glucanase (GH16 family)
MSFTRIATSSLALFATSAHAAYTLQDDYTSGDFFSMFKFWDNSVDGADPTNGAVLYVPQDVAESGYSNNGAAGDPLIKKNDDGTFYMGADHNATLSGTGRPSVRITSNNQYNSGLFILDLAHMPGGECASWPAFWLLGGPATWPAAGEVDIIEGVNNQPSNDMTLHTSEFNPFRKK